MTKKEEQIKLEHSTLLVEYGTMREEILFQIEASKQMVNLTLTAAGILIAGTPYIIQSQLPILFLVAPLIFYAFAWVQMRTLISTINPSEYIVNILVPRIRRTLVDLGSEKESDFSSIMSWDMYARKADSSYNLLLIPTVGGFYGLNLLASALAIIAFFVNQNLQSISVVDTVLIALNGIFFLYTLALGFWARIFLWRKIEHQNLPKKPTGSNN